MNLRNSLVTDLSSKLRNAAQKIRYEDDPVAWIEKDFFIPETKNDPDLRGRLILQPYQRDTLREALSKDENGHYKYSIIIWSDIKKSIKSTIAAAVNLARAHTVEWGEFYVVANDLKQANSRVSRYIRRSILLNPKTNPKKNGEYRMNGYEIRLPNGSLIEAIPIDPSGEAGSNADQITWSELWGSNETAKQRMWSEMTLSPTKHGKSFRWIESYAGFTEDSDLLYSLYEMGVKEGRLLWPDRLYDVTDGEPAPLELYVNEQARMLCLWNTKPRNPWQTKEYYAAEEAVLTPNEFLRMHRNQWVSSTETFVPIEWWHACRRSDEEYPQIDKKRHPVIVTIDAAVSGAALGLWAGCIHPNHPQDIIELYANKWEPGGEDHKIDYYGTEGNPGMDLELRRLIREYNVVMVAYDEFQLHSYCSALKKEGLTWFRPFPQGKDRLIGDSLFRDMIRERRYWHRGNKAMTEHVQNADAKVDPEDRKIRIVKGSEKRNVDLAVCAAMGCRELMRLNL